MANARVCESGTRMSASARVLARADRSRRARHTLDSIFHRFVRLDRALA